MYKIKNQYHFYSGETIELLLKNTYHCFIHIGAADENARKTNK